MSKQFWCGYNTRWVRESDMEEKPGEGFCDTCKGTCNSSCSGDCSGDCSCDEPDIAFGYTCECMPPERTPKAQDETHYHKIAIELANLVEEKNKAYGNAASECQIFLELLYPNGVPVSAYENMLFLVRLWDKIKRIATNEDAFGEDPAQDIAGYCLQRLNNKLKEN